MKLKSKKLISLVFCAVLILTAVILIPQEAGAVETEDEITASRLYAGRRS